MASELCVYHHRQLVGVIEVVDDRFRFQYSEAWLSDSGRFAISLSLPLTHESHTGQEAHFFFWNLLPEGGVRTLVAELTSSPDYS